jgi:hypothetical protein
MSERMKALDGNVSTASVVAVAVASSGCPGDKPRP